MTVKYDFHGSESMHWMGMAGKSFDEICSISNIKPEWKNWEYVKKNPFYYNKIIKPLNMYCDHFGIFPGLKEDGDKLILNYFNYADIYIYNKGYIFYVTEKSWMRQFYPVLEINQSIPDNLIKNRPFKFFIPFVIDKDIEYEVIEGYYDNCIYVPKQYGIFKKDNNDKIKEANFINFYFKDFLNNNGYYIIKRGTNIFSIIIDDKDLKDRILDEYNKVYSIG